MLNLTACKISRSDEMAYLSSAPVTAVGQALVQNGAGAVKPGTGGAGELFVGASLSQPMTLLAFPKVEYLVANASGIITLSATPAAGTLRLVADETGSALAAGNPASSATEYSISGVTVTEHVSRATKTTRCFYQFVPDTVTARLLQGDVQPGGAASLTTGTVGVIRAGLIYTSEWDTTVDWTAANPAVKVGANGRFTIGGSGGDVPHAQVMAAPSTTDAMLGLYFSA